MNYSANNCFAGRRFLPTVRHVLLSAVPFLSGMHPMFQERPHSAYGRRESGVRDVNNSPRNLAQVRGGEEVRALRPIKVHRRTERERRTRSIKRIPVALSLIHMRLECQRTMIRRQQRKGLQTFSPTSVSPTPRLTHRSSSNQWTCRTDDVPDDAEDGARIPEARTARTPGLNERKRATDTKRTLSASWED